MLRTMSRAGMVAGALVLISAAEAAAAKPIPLGDAGMADVAVDAAGTAHVATTSVDGQQVTYCAIPRGARACARRTPLAMPGSGNAQALHVQVNGATVLVTTWRAADAPDGDGPAVAVSTDGGATFAPGVRHASSGLLHGQQTLGPDGALWHASSSGGYLRTVRLALDGSTPTTMPDVQFDDDGGSGDAGIAVAGGTVIAVRDGAAAGFTTHAVGGDAAARAAWSAITPIAPLVSGDSIASPSLAAGAKGAVLTAVESGGLRGTVTARRWTGAGFSAPVKLYEHEGGSNNANNGEVAADASGRLHAVLSGDNERSLRYARSGDGGRTWSPAMLLTDAGIDAVVHSRVSAAPDGQGFATLMSKDRAFAVALEPSAGLPGEPTVATRVTVGDRELALGLPKGCLPAGDVRVTLTQRSRKVKRRKASGDRVVVKVTRADFSVDGRRVKRDRRAPFTQTLRLVGLAPGSTHEVRARAFLKVRSGPQRTRSIRRKVKICA